MTKQQNNETYIAYVQWEISAGRIPQPFDAWTAAKEAQKNVQTIVLRSDILKGFVTFKVPAFSFSEAKAEAWRLLHQLEARYQAQFANGHSTTLSVADQVKKLMAELEKQEAKHLKKEQKMAAKIQQLMKEQFGE